MSHLLAMSFDGAASPNITLKAVVEREGLEQPFGWGFAWYPTEDFAAIVVKDPTTLGDNAMTKVLRDWERFLSTVFVCHLRGAAKRTKEQDTQPFLRSYARRDWLLAHNGDLVGDLVKELPLEEPAFEPVGQTDSERAFCWLLARIRDTGARRLADVGWDRLYELCRKIDSLGTANLIVTDGQDLLVYHDSARFNGLYYIHRKPPHRVTELDAEDIHLDLGDAHDLTRTLVVFSTFPLSEEAWISMEGGQMIVARRGAILWDSLSTDSGIPRAAQAGPVAAPPVGTDAGPVEPPPWASIGALAPDASAMRFHRVAEPVRRLKVLHETRYQYQEPVERSFHLLRLRPVHDARQQVLESTVELSVDGLRRDYEDVFGNSATGVDVESPFSELRVRARSIVSVSDASADVYRAFGRNTVPPVWMPWQRQMMLPYLLPPELPETQLRELYEYAMSYVQRQDYDLVQTVFDMNQTIYRDYSYVSGSTTLETTPFEVYVNRRGVCQDFANLLICLARLISVPARYRVGYIYTGGDYENKVQSEASHAWAELYLPFLGWYGFDPTNGCLAGKNHVRVAAGRNYRDATPTSGTIYKGGGRETLKVSVRVEED